MTRDDKKNNETPGFIPQSGFMTAKALAKLLQVRDWENLRDTLIAEGVEHKKILRGCYLFKLESLENLFFD